MWILFYDILWVYVALSQKFCMVYAHQPQPIHHWSTGRLPSGCHQRAPGPGRCQPGGRLLRSRANTDRSQPNGRLGPSADVTIFQYRFHRTSKDIGISWEEHWGWSYTTFNWANKHAARIGISHGGLMDIGFSDSFRWRWNAEKWWETDKLRSVALAMCF